MKKFQKWCVAALVLAATLCGCGGSDSGGGGIGGTGVMPAGTLRLAITDAPSCGYDAVNITIERVRVNASAGASDADLGWYDIVLAPAKRIDLLTLSNGVVEELGETPLPAGKYTQLRLVLAANDAASPLSNSVVPTGGVETALTTPSAQQSGLKLNIDIDVASGQVADFILDFDACKSVVKRGNSGQYNLKPVIRVIPRVSSAGLRVVGYVDPSVANGATEVSLQSNGVPVKSTPPNPSGQFVLSPVPIGTYDLVVTSPNHVTAVMTAVLVTDTATTNVNTASLAIALPDTAQAPRVVSGTVTPASATVRALQTLTAGPTVQVAWAPVDAISGQFGFSLPLDAPVATTYVPDRSSLSFTSDAGAASHYSIEAMSGAAIKTQAIDVSGAVAPLSFVFP
jgi:hypothetical protein